jgi:hypothetical protein
MDIEWVLFNGVVVRNIFVLPVFLSTLLIWPCFALAMLACSFGCGVVPLVVVLTAMFSRLFFSFLLSFSEHTPILA